MKQETLKIQEYELPIAVQEEDGAYIATCPVWQDCYAQANTIEEAINEISSVASSLIEVYKEEGMTMPLKSNNTISKEQNGFKVKIPLIVSAD